MKFLALLFKILTFPTVIFLLAKTEKHYKKSQFEKALKTIIRYSKIYGRDAASEAYKLILYTKLKKYDACKEIVANADEEMQSTTAFATAASLYYSAIGDFFNAIRMTKPFLEGKKHLAHHHNNIGYYYSRIHEYEKSIEHLNEVIRHKPDYAFAWNNRGFSKFNAGDTEGGLSDIEKSLELDPNNAYAYKNRAKIYIELNKKDAAISDLNKALQLNYREKFDNEVDALLEKFGVLSFELKVES